MEILKNRLFPPPFNSTSTISIPSDWATRSAMASIFERIAVLILLQTLQSNKKVGFRPLHEFDTYNLIVPCPEENATFPVATVIERFASLASELGFQLAK